jgi:hypothetical protein
MTTNVGLSSDFHLCSYSHLSASDSDRPKQFFWLIKQVPADVRHTMHPTVCSVHQRAEVLQSSLQHRCCAFRLTQGRILALPHSWEVAPATFGIMWTGGLQAQAHVSVDVKLFVCHSQRRGQACAQTIVKRTRDKCLH